MGIRMGGLLLDIIGTIQDTNTGDSIIILDLNDITVATVGRMIDIEAIPEQWMVEEEEAVVVTVEDADNN